MRRAALAHIGGWLCAVAAVVLLVSGVGSPGHGAGFWWLKAAAVALACLAWRLLRSARRLFDENEH